MKKAEKEGIKKMIEALQKLEDASKQVIDTLEVNNMKQPLIYLYLVEEHKLQIIETYMNQLRRMICSHKEGSR